MIHSHPVTVDIIAGEMNISSCQMLIGMPAMADKKTYIICAEGTAGMEDDDGGRWPGMRRASLAN